MIFSITNPAPAQRITVTRRRFVRQPPVWRNPEALMSITLLWQIPCMAAVNRWLRSPSQRHTPGLRPRWREPSVTRDADRTRAHLLALVLRDRLELTGEQRIPDIQPSRFAQHPIGGNLATPCGAQGGRRTISATPRSGRAVADHLCTRGVERCDPIRRSFGAAWTIPIAELATSWRTLSSH